MSDEPNSVIKTIITGSAWSFVGVLMAAAFFYWQEYRNPFEFRIEVIDEFNLVEVKEKISDLKILYKNDDIIESQKEIKVVRINLNNPGETLLQSYYDQLESFGLRFSKSKILDAEVTTSNSADLKEKLVENISPSQSDEYDDLILSKVIFDKNDFAIIKVVLLQSAGQDLVITPLGKLANIESLDITYTKAEASEPVSPWIYIVGGYFGFLLFLFGVVFIISSFEDMGKKKRVKKYRDKHSAISDDENKIIDLYLNMGSRTEKMISSILANDYALDFSDIIKAQQPSGLSKILLPLSHIWRMQFQALPKEIFSIDGTTVSLNEEHSEFIKSFFGEVL